jgi:alpha-tubulin suppressor-like RCC1 family protein
MGDFLWKVGVARANAAELATRQFAAQPSDITAEKLEAAARQGDARATERILGGAKVDGSVLSEALRTAARGGHADVIKQLIDSGADVNAPDDDGYTCFHTACFWGQETVLPLLAAKGARARGLTRVGRTGWDLASRNGCSRAVAVLTSLGMQETGDQFERMPHAPLAGQPKVDGDEQAVKTPPAIMGCGSNLRGQLGCPGMSTSTVMRSVPLPDTLGTLPIAVVGCGEGHTLFIAQGGDEVFGCGSNHSGQLGLGRIPHENHSSQCDTVIDIVAPTCRVPKLCGLSLTALACGDSHTLALTAAGVVMCCGANKLGQLGLGHSEPEVWNPTANSMTGVTSVTAGSFHSFFLKIPEVWACGNNKLGQLGLSGGSVVIPTRVESLDGEVIVQVACGATQSWFLTKEGSVWHIRGTEWPPAPPPEKLELPADDEVVAISAGGHHALFLTVSGNVWALGSNTAGQLGVVSRDGSSVLAVAKPTIVEAFQRLTHCSVRLSTHGIALAKLGRSCVREGDIGQVISRDPSGRRSKVKGGRRGDESW